MAEKKTDDDVMYNYEAPSARPAVGMPTGSRHLKPLPELPVFSVPNLPPLKPVGLAPFRIPKSRSPWSKRPF